MTESISAGLRSALRHPKLLWLLWAWFSLLALVPALPAWTWWNGALGASPEAASVLSRFDMGVLTDVTAGKGINGIGLLTGTAAAAGIIALVSSAFAFGGIIEVLGSGDDSRSFMHRFFRGGGHFFWRYFRLAIMAAVCAVLATGAVSALMTALMKPLRESEWEPGFYLGSMATTGAVLLVAAFFMLALDYARIRVARDDSRSMLRAYVAGVGFVLRRMPAVYGILIAFLLLEVVLVAAYLAYETNTPAAGTWGALAALFIVQQAVVFGRVAVRVALVGGERHYHLAALPPRVPVVASPAEEPPAPEAPAPGLPSPGAGPEAAQIPTESS